MLFKNFKKIDVSEFDFTKSAIHVKAKKEKTAWNKFFSLFLGTQLLFFIYDGFLLQNQLIQKGEETQKNFPTYEKLRASLKAGDDEQVINNFIHLKSAPFAINDLLSASIINLIYIDDTIERNKKEEYNINIKPETKQLLTSIYLNNINSGLKKENYTLKNTQCFLLDLSCQLLKPILFNQLIQYNSIIEDKLNIANYDIAHPKEFKEWYKNTSKILATGNPMTEVLKSPGHIYYKQK